MDLRQSWDEYYLDIAEQASSRSTCTNRKVGAVVVSNRNSIVSTGYNGGPSGYPHCSEGACPRSNSGATTGIGYEECIAIHAEANALLRAAPQDREGATLYCTLAPCFGCAKLIANSGISLVVVRNVYDGYRNVADFLLDCGVRFKYNVDMSIKF